MTTPHSNPNLCSANSSQCDAERIADFEALCGQNHHHQQTNAEQSANSFLPSNKRKSGAARTEGEPDLHEQAIRHHLRTEAKVNWYRRSAWLLVWFLCLFVLLRWLE